jgi:guanine nucleotide-binding protein G(i) subunit alpha
MKMIHANGYSDEEKESFKEIIFSNSVQSMKVIVEAMHNMAIQLQDSAKATQAEMVEDADNQVEGEVFPSELANAIKVLWEDDGIRATFERSSEYQLNDSAR